MPPPDSNKKIEELLQGYSRKRREQLEPGVDLHPVSRKALLNEVNQIPPAPSAKPAAKKMGFIWWQWLVAGFVGIWVIVLFRYVEVPTPPAAIEPAAPVVVERGNSAAPVASPAPAPAAPSSQVASASAPPTGDVTAHLERKIRTEEVAADRAQVAQNPVRGSQVSATPPTATPASTTPIIAAAPVAANSANAPVADAAAINPSARSKGDVRLFVTVDNHAQMRVNVHSPPMPKVLTSFAIERIGDQVKVQDADGSIYQGQVTSSSGADAYNFSVSGTSDTLNQSINFTGKVLGDTSNIIRGHNITCTGDVQVGADTEFPLKAVPVK